MYNGDCNGCGQCCTALVAGENGKFVLFRCQNLLVADKLGRPGASSCAIHSQRTFGMPILMVAEDGSGAFRSRCVSTYPREQDAVPPECSYQWNGKGAKPVFTILYAPRL